MKKLICWTIGIFFSVLASAQVPTSGLVAYYPFNGNANDASGNGNNGTVSAGVTLQSDRFGNSNASYYFSGISGSDPQIKFPASYGATNSSFTFSVWLKPDNNNHTANQYPVFGNFYNNTFPNGENSWTSWYFQVNGSAYGPGTQGLINTGRIPSAGGNNNLNTTSTVTTTSWTHVLFTFNATTSQISIYLNGVLNSSNTFSSFTPKTFNNFIIGREYDGGSNSFASTYFSGQIDDIAIYNRVLTPCEINQLAGLTISAPAFTSSNPSSSSVGQTTTYTISPVTSATSYVWRVDNTIIPTATSTSFTKTWINSDVGNRVVSVSATLNNCIYSNTITSNIAIGSTNFDIISTPIVRNDSLILQMNVVSTATSYLLGNSSIGLQLTFPGLNIAQAGLFYSGSSYTFGQSPSYFPITLSTAAGVVTLNINANTASGTGTLVTNNMKLADIAIPFTSCPTGSTIRYNGVTIRTFSGSDITTSANLRTSSVPSSLIPATILGQTLTCINGTATLTAFPAIGYSYLWSNGNTNRVNVASIPGIQSVTLTQIAGGCSATANILGGPLALATTCMSITASGTVFTKSNGFQKVVVCPGSAQLRATNCTRSFVPVVRFSWQRVKAGVPIGSAVITPIYNLANVDSTEMIVVTVTEYPNGLSGCSQSTRDTVRLKQDVLPVVTVGGYDLLGNLKSDPLNIFECSVDTVVLRAGNNAGITNYTWTLNTNSLSNAIPGQNSSILKIQASTNFSNYFVSVFSANGCRASAPSPVFVAQKRSYSFGFVSATDLCSNGQTTLTVNTNGTRYPDNTLNGFENLGGGLVDSLYFTFGDPASGTSNLWKGTTEFGKHSFSQGGFFTVTGILVKKSSTNANNHCPSRHDTVIYINQRPIVDIKTTLGLDTAKLCPGNSGVSLAVTGTLGGSPYNFIWKGPGSVDNQTSTSVSYTPSGIGLTKIFASITSDAFGCSSKNVDSILVYNSNNPVVSIIAPVGKDTLCAGIGTVLTTVGTGNLVHLWSSSPVDASLSTVNGIATVAPTILTVYTNTVTDKTTGCSTTATKTQYVSDLALSNITTSNFKPYCANSGAVAFTTTVLGSVNFRPYTYVWSVSPSGSAGISSPTTVTSNSFVGSLTAAPTGAGNVYVFNVSVRDKFGCTPVNAAPLSLDVKPVPTLSFINPLPVSLSLCVGNSQQFTNLTVSGGTFATLKDAVWSPSSNVTTVNGAFPTFTPSAPGTVSFLGYIEDDNFCRSNSVTVSVTGNALPDLSTINSNVLIKGCFGSAPTTISIPNSNLNNFIRWRETTQNVSYPSFDNSLSFNISSSGTYEVTVTVNGTNCTASASQKASYIVPPGGNKRITPSVTFPCSYTVLNVWASDLVGDSLLYQWSTTNASGTLQGTTNDTVTYLATPADVLVGFSYTISNRCGTDQSGVNTVTYLPTPVANLVTNTPETFLNKPMIFTNKSLNTDRPATLFLGNGSVVSSFPTNIPLPVQYGEQGDYVVKLRIRNNNGCSDSVSFTVGVIGTKTVFIPNVFSPNANDNDNKTFRVFGTNILNQDFSCQVYNRFGQKVYETTNFDEANVTGWNGTIPNAFQQAGEGIYTYAVKGKFVDGSTFERTGTVTMLK